MKYKYETYLIDLRSKIHHNIVLSKHEVFTPIHYISTAFYRISITFLAHPVFVPLHLVLFTENSIPEPPNIIVFFSDIVIILDLWIIIRVVMV